MYDRTRGNMRNWKICGKLPFLLEPSGTTWINFMISIGTSQIWRKPSRRVESSMERQSTCLVVLSRMIMSEFNIINKAIGHAEYEDRTGDCYLELMRAADLFNPQLVQIFNELNSEAGSDVFNAANAFQFHMDFITNPQVYGFVTAKVACCGQGPYSRIGLCTIVLNLCPNRDEYAFWDPFHPREKANRIIVSMIMTRSTNYIYPMNLSTILAMDART